MEITKIKRYFLDRGMLQLYTLYVAGYFLMPMASGHRRLYYILVFPAVLLLWKELGKFYRANTLFHLVLAYSAYMMASLAWTENFSTTGASWALWNTVNALSFCFVTGFLWARQPSTVNTLAHWAIVLAGAAAGVSVLVWYIDNPFPGSRVIPLGVMHHENKASAAYGIFLVLAVHYLTAGHRRENKLQYILPGLAIFALVAFTQSRTAMAGVCVALVVLMGWRGLIVLLVGLSANWLLVAAEPSLWTDRVLTFSFRPGIWQTVIDNMHGYWVFGHGYLVNEQVQAYGKIFDHAHNSYLASLRDGGLIGLVLLLAILGVALRWSVELYRQQGNRLYLALLLYSMVCISMDFDRLLTQPKELWLYFWLPIGLIMATYPNSGNNKAELSHAKT